MKYWITAGIFFLTVCTQQTLNAQTKQVETIGITVKEMNRSVKFYSEVIGFKKIDLIGAKTAILCFFACRVYD